MDSKPTVEVIDGPYRPNISFNGRLLYPDASSPEKRAEGLPQKPEALYIIISPLLFHGSEMLSELIPKEAAVLSIERDSAVYRRTLEYHKSSTLSDWDYILLESDGSAILCEYIKRFRCREIIPVKLNHGYMLNRKYYDHLLSEARDFLSRFWKNRMTTIHMGRLWCRNIFINLSSMPEASFISELKTGKPVFCAGAGESLEGSIDFIRDNRDEIFLTAADTAVSCLLAKDIKPDLIIALESQHANLYDFYNNDSLDIPVAADLTSSPELRRKLRGPVYLFLTEFDFSSVFGLLDEYGLLPPMLPALGSVGITALLISLMISNRNVAFSGLDFSFIPDKYHAAGAPSHIISMLRENRTSRQGFYQSAYNPVRNRVKDKSGRTVYTDITMRSYADSLNRLIEKSGRIIDAGSLGLPNSASHCPGEKLPDLLFSGVEAPSQFSIGTAYSRVIPDTEKPGIGSAAAFLRNELEKLSSAIRITVDFQNKRDDDSRLPDGLADALIKLDYTWLFFPDKGPLPSADSSFLKRFLFSAAWFSAQIEKALNLVNHQT